MRILNIHLTILLITFYSLSVAQVNKKYLVTPTSFDKINKNANYDDLIKLYGKNNIKDTIYFGPEGMDSSIITQIYTGSPKEILIFWEETLFHKKIGSIESYRQKAPYFTIDGLKIGSSLRRLVQVNRKKINFYGFGWDYGGIISSFNKGKFEKSNFEFQLDSKFWMDGKLIGDIEFNTDMRLVKENLDKIFIGTIRLNFK
jgi:hypothetical protein